MAKGAADAKAKFQPYHEEYLALVAALKKLRGSKDWNIKAQMFGDPKVRGASIRMWKKAWPEDLHFKSWIGNADIERGSASVAFHIETSLDEFGVRRNRFNEELIEKGADLMDEWDGFSLSPKSFQTFKRQIPYEEGKIAKVLKPEFLRFQRLGKVIDQALNL